MGSASKFSGWHMVGLALLAQNMGLGLFYGSFGAMLSGLEQQAGMSRVQSSFGFTAVLVLMALSSTFAGAALSTRNVRWVMAGGLALASLAYGVLATAETYLVYLLACAAIGATIGVSSIICPLMLISRWFNAKRGLALGFGNVPIVLSLSPLAIAAALPALGLHFVLWIESGICLFAALFVAVFLVERPADVGQEPLGGELPASAAPQTAAPKGNLSFLGDWRFWSLAFGLGVLNGSANIFFAHIIPFATETGHTLQQGSTLTFAYGVAGLVGVPLGGWLADRIGASAVVALMCAISAAFFETLAFQMDMAIVFVFCAAFGAFLCGLVAAQGLTISELFRPEQIGRIAGVIFLAQLPIMAGAPPFIGNLRILSGSYIQAFHLVAGICVLASALMLITASRRQTMTAASRA